MYSTTNFQQNRPITKLDRNTPRQQERITLDSICPISTFFYPPEKVESNANFH